MSTIIAQKYWVPNEFGFAIMTWASIWTYNWSKSTLQNCSRLILPTIAIAFAILFTFKGETEIFLGLLSFLIWHKLILDWTTHSLWKKRWFTGKCGWGFPIFSSCAISPAEWKKVNLLMEKMIGWDPWSWSWGLRCSICHFFTFNFAPALLDVLDDRVPPYKRFKSAFI